MLHVPHIRALSKFTLTVLITPKKQKDLPLFGKPFLNQFEFFGLPQRRVQNSSLR